MDGCRFVVHKPIGLTRTFKQSRKGLFYLNMRMEDRKQTSRKNATVLINTIEDNRNKYSKIARCLQTVIGLPSNRPYKSILKNNLLKNCPINTGNVNATDNIWGSNLGCLQCKPYTYKPHQI